MQPKRVWIMFLGVVFGVMGGLIFLQVRTTGYYFFDVELNKTIKPNGELCNDIEIRSSNKYGEPIKIIDKVVYINFNLLDQLKISKEYAVSFNVSSPPILYNYIEERDNIVIIGDSFTKATGVDYNESYPYFLSKSVNKNVINLGISNYNTLEEMKRFDKIGRSYYPKIVILQYYENDINDGSFLVNLIFNIQNELLKKGLNCTNQSPYLSQSISAKLFNLYYREIIASNKQKLFNKNVMLPFIHLIEESKEMNFSIILLLVSSDANTVYLKNVADNLSWVRTIEITNAIDGFSFNPPFSISKYNFHFSTLIHKKIAKLLNRTINDMGLT